MIPSWFLWSRIGIYKIKKMVLAEGLGPPILAATVFETVLYTNSNMPASKKMVLREGFEPSVFSSRVSDFKSEMSQPIASPKYKNGGERGIRTLGCFNTSQV
jgi:hypothetical protein